MLIALHRKLVSAPFLGAPGVAPQQGTNLRDTLVQTQKNLRENAAALAAAEGCHFPVRHHLDGYDGTLSVMYTDERTHVASCSGVGFISSCLDGGRPTASVRSF